MTTITLDQQNQQAEQFAERCLAALDARMPGYNHGITDKEMLATLAGSYSAFQLMLKQQKARDLRGRNIPPPLEEVSVYVKEIGARFDPDEFMLFYNERGWKLSGGIPMKDWKATAQRWHRGGWGLNQRPGVPGEISNVRASLGAMQMQLEKIQDEIRNIVRPGGSAHARSASSVSPEEMKRYDELCAQRDNLKKRIGAAL